MAAAIAFGRRDKTACCCGALSNWVHSCPNLAPPRRPVLDAQDLNLEGFIDDAFVLSPAQLAGPEPGPGGAAPLLLASLPDAPKIRVIVRKRPLNKKVGLGPLAKTKKRPGCPKASFASITRGRGVRRSLVHPPAVGAGARRDGRAGVRRRCQLPVCE